MDGKIISTDDLNVDGVAIWAALANQKHHLSENYVLTQAFQRSTS